MDKSGKIVDGEGNTIHLPLAFPPHILTESPVNINNWLRGSIAQQPINIHAKSSAEDVNFPLLAKLVAAPCIVGEKSSKVTLVAPWTIVFRVRIWLVTKVSSPLNDTRTKEGWGRSCPYRFAKDHVVIIFF
jgi:hypothetical protein